jgi:hypothetical protein
LGFPVAGAVRSGGAVDEFADALSVRSLTGVAVKNALMLALPLSLPASPFFRGIV